MDTNECTIKREMPRNVCTPLFVRVLTSLRMIHHPRRMSNPGVLAHEGARVYVRRGERRSISSVSGARGCTKAGLVTHRARVRRMRSALPLKYCTEHSTVDIINMLARCTNKLHTRHSI